jgi:hypothetical protein
LQAISRSCRVPLQTIILLLAAGFIAGCGTSFNVDAQANANAQTALSPASLNWSKVAVGQTGGPKSATISNAGSTTIQISGVGLGGADPGDFAIYKNTCGSSLAPAASCTATVLFKPTSSGTRTATLNFNDNSGGSPQQIALSGLGTSAGDSASGGTASVSPSSISWSNVNVGNAGGPKSTTLTNTGSGSINISSVGFTGTDASDFAIYQNTCGASLAASAGCTVTVLFKPTASGTRTATLAFTDSVAGSPQEVSLSGLGVSSGTVTASTAGLSFGSISVGGTSDSQSVTITNSTSSAVPLSGAGISGTNAGDFAVSSTNCGSSLAASASCTTNLLFKPTATGTRSATWAVNDGSGTLSVALSGTGTAAAGSAGASPSSISWGSVAVGNAGGPKTATLTNTGSSALNISSVAFTGTNAGDFAVYQNTCAANLAVSASCTVTILFKPTTSGTRTATLNFTDSAGNSPQQVAVSGLGTGGTTGTVAASPGTLPFGSVDVGSTSSAQAVTVTNSTSSSVTLSGAGISGTNPADFSVASTTCGSTLAASASCVANIVFKPTASGARSASWSITSSSSSTPLSAALSGTGTNPSGSVTATVAPGSITWSSVAVGQAGGPKTATVTNTGTSAVNFSSIAFSGTNASDFAIYQQTCGSSLAASASCTVTILFKPTTAGTRTATLDFTDNAAGSPQQVAVSGVGTGGATGTVAVAPGSLSFGSIAVGSTSSAQAVTVTNSTSSSVTLSGAGISGTNASDFSVASTTCGSTLAASASCVANIVFKPTASGARSASWMITSSSSSTPFSVALSGTGASSGSGTVTVSPTTLTFPQTSVGSASSTMNATLMNGTASSITISGIAIQGADADDFVQLSTTCGATLAASASCTVSIAFKPSATGTRSATLNFSDSAGNSPQSVALSGVGVTAGSATVSPSSIGFGSIVVGQTSSSRMVVLKNLGSAAIAVSSKTIAGANPGDFAITSNSCGTSLGASASCDINLTFSPTAAGARSATLSIADGATNSPQTVALSGTGTPAPTATITISPSNLDWGSPVVGVAGAPQSFTLTSGGSGSVSFSSLSFTGADAGDFSITSNTCGTTLAQGSSCTVTVVFKPSAIGNRVALFSVSDNAIASPQTAEVSGTGANSTPQIASVTVDFGSRSGSQVVIPANILGTEYLESLPTNANRATVVQGGFTTARYRLDVSTVYHTQTPSWGAFDNDMTKFVAAGVHPLIELVNTPSFLQPSPLLCAGAPTTSVPTDVNMWGQLVASILAHLDQKFPGLVQNYEIWNEPDTTALCSNNRISDYLRIYAAAAPQLKAQAKTDGVSIFVGGPAAAGPAFPTLMTDSTTAPYVDFYSYHVYEGDSNDVKNGMTWDGAGGTPSLRAMVLDPKKGVQALYLQAYNQVKAGKTPLGAKTPIYFDEYNDDWAFVPECCRNSPTYSPLFNSMTVAQLLNSVYNGAGEVPSMMIYYSAGQQTFCILGVIDSAMDCTKAATGAQAQPYPQWYTYRLIFNPSFLDLQDGGHMAASVTLSSSASSAGLIATGYYTAAKESVLIINPTASSFAGVTLQINNSGLSSPSATLYTINAGNPYISQWPASTLAASGGQQITFDLPSYSVIAVSLQ